MPPSPLLSALSLNATLCLAIGLYMLWLQGRGSGQAYRASAGILLLVLSACQAKMAYCLFRQGRRPSARAAPLLWAFAGRLLVGMVLCYAATLGVESPTAASHLFIAGLAAWYTALLIPVVFPQSFAGLVHGPAHRWLHRFESAAIVAAVLLATAESGLRILDWCSGHPLFPTTAMTHLKLAPGTTVRGLAVNRHGYWDEEFEPHTGDKLRVAVLGGEVVLGGTRPLTAWSFWSDACPTLKCTTLASRRAARSITQAN